MYHHTEDIDRKNTQDVSEIDDQIRLLVNRSINALSNSSKRDATFDSLIETVLLTFIGTHKSIMLLLKQADSDSDYASDAMSLVREQVEKVFVLILILDNPQKWIQVYFKDDWRRFYEYEVLLNSEERKNLEEFQMNEQREKDLQEYQNAIGVSDLEKEWVEFKFNNPGAAIPQHLEGAAIVGFPTPGNVRKCMENKSAEEFLIRLHKEYKRICGYSHIGLDKLQVTAMRVTTNNISESNKGVFVEQALKMPVLWTSYLAIACACTELYKSLQQYDPDVSRTGDLLEALFEIWFVLEQKCLLGKVFWDVRAKKILPPLIR